MNRHRAPVLVLTLSLILPRITGAQVESTTGGGPWTQPTTWKDNVVPGPADDVLIRGPVTLDFITQVKSLRILPGGSVRPEVITTSTLYKLQVAQDLTNEGALTGFNLEVRVGGNVYNSGQWQCNAIVIADTGRHYFTAFPGSPLTALAIAADSATVQTSGPVVIDSAVVRIGTFVLGNNNPVMPNDTLYLNRHVTFRVNRFIGNGNAIVLSGGSFLGNVAYGNGTPVYDNVHLYGEVEIGGNKSFTGDIQLFGTMQPHYYNSSPTLAVHGNFTNNGEIAPGPNGYELIMQVDGNFTNNGTCELELLEFTGNGTHLLATDPVKRFSPRLLRANTSTVQSASLIRLDNVHAYFHHLELQAGHGLYLNEQSILQVDELDGGGNILQLLDGSYLGPAVAPQRQPLYRHVRLKGQVDIGSNIQIVGDTPLEGTMQPHFYNSAPTVSIFGNFENRGDIRPGPNGYTLVFNIDGDIRNVGSWQSDRITLPGKGPYTLATDSSGTFSPAALRGDSATVRSGSSLWLDDCDVEVHEIVLNDGHDLNLRNGSTLKADRVLAGGRTVRLSGNSYLADGLQQGKAEYHDAVLDGEVRIGTSLSFFGPTTLTGSMLPYFFNSSPTLEFHGPFQNYGSLLPGPNGYRLTLIMHDDITSMGPWHSGFVTWSGNGSHTLTLDTTRVFSPQGIRADSATVISGSPLRFDNVEARLHRLVLQKGHNLFMTDGWLRTDELVGNGNVLIMAGDAYLGSAASPSTQAVLRDLTLSGDVGIGANLWFAGRIYLQGTMAPHFYTQAPTLTFLDYFQNRGQIVPGPNGYRFVIYVQGDLENAGLCQSDVIQVQGTRDQHLGIQDSAASLSQVYLEAGINGNSFQWLRDGQPLSNSGNLSGTTSSTLRFTSLTPAESGTYQCRVDSAGTVRLSRKIVVNNTITSVASPDRRSPDLSSPGAPDGGTAGLPQQYILEQNYPNPFNPRTVIRFALPVQARVRLTLYDAAGRQQAELVNGVFAAGFHRVVVERRDLASGVYVYRLVAKPLSGATPAFVATRKMLLLR